MASTITPSKALDYCKAQIKAMPLEKIITRGINRVAHMIWMYAPWRWTLGSMTTFSLASNTQDYSVAHPADFMYVHRAIVSDGTSPERILEIVPSLETAVGLIGQPSQIAYLGAAGATATVRVSPKPATISGTQTVLGLYKKVMTQFTNATIYTSFMPFDDEWYWVFEEGLLWQSYLFADDRRAGEASADKEGNVKYSGQRANFEAALITMREREPLVLSTGFFQLDQKERGR